jgi:hypothetical protein
MAMFNGKINYKWQFSIAMLNYQRVRKMRIETVRNWVRNHRAEVLEERRQAKEERQRREAPVGSASSCGRVGKILIGKQ